MRILRRPLVAELVGHGVRAALLVVLGCAVSLAVNVVHPMGLPLTLSRVTHSGVPNWVWDATERVPPERGRELWQSGKVYVVDVRDRVDFAKGHIPGAINLPYHEFSTAYPQVSPTLPHNGPLLIYCYEMECGLSMRVAKRLLRLDWTGIYLLDRGYHGWSEEGYEVVGEPWGPTEEDRR